MEVEVFKESLKYGERKRVGQLYSDYMNARLVLLGNKLLSAGIPLNVVKNMKGHIYDITNPTRIELNDGLWYSAEREAEKMQPSPDLQQMIDTMSLPIYQQELIDEINAKIQLEINNLY